jgi:hypothetical protein
VRLVCEQSAPLESSIPITSRWCAGSSCRPLMLTRDSPPLLSLPRLSVNRVSKTLPSEARACAQQTGLTSSIPHDSRFLRSLTKIWSLPVDDPTGAWDSFYHVKSHLAGYVLNYGVRKVRASLKIIGAVESVSTKPAASSVVGSGTGTGGEEWGGAGHGARVGTKAGKSE